MSKVFGGMFTTNAKVQMASLTERMNRSKVINANIANAETPGYRALGYDFEKQLQAIVENSKGAPLKTTHPLHFKNPLTTQDGSYKPDVFVRPSESVAQDGNTVDLDGEMAQLAENQLLFQATVELINRNIGRLKYAIDGGR